MVSSRPVQELRPEHLAHLFDELALHVLVRDLAGLGDAAREHATQVVRRDDLFRAHVGGEDQDRVLEVHHPADVVGQAALLHDLEQHVPDIGVRLFDLVEQHHRVRLAADLLGELAALFVTDVAGGRAHQAADVVLLHVLGHVELHDRRLVAEHELRQRLGEQRFAHARRPGEDERADRPLRVFQPRAALAYRLRERLNRFVLADDRAVQFVLHFEQALGLVLADFFQRHAGHLGDDFADHVLIDDAVGLLGFFAPLLGQRLFFLAQLVRLVAQARGPFQNLVRRPRTLFPC